MTATTSSGTSTTSATTTQGDVPVATSRPAAPGTSTPSSPAPATAVGSTSDTASEPTATPSPTPGELSPAASPSIGGLGDPLPGETTEGEATFSSADDSSSPQVLLARTALVVSVLLLVLAIGRELVR